MSLKELVDEFVKTEIGGVMVTDDAGSILYSDNKAKLSDHTLKRFLARLPQLNCEGERRTWELTESDGGKYYRILSVAKVYDGKLCRFHCLSDVSDLADLSKDISEYSRRISDYSDFQTKIMNLISKSYDTFLPALAELCCSDEAVIRLERLWSGKIAVTSYNGTVTHKTYKLDGSKNYDEMFDVKRFETFGGYRCLMSESVADRRCVVLLKDSDRFSNTYFKDISVYNTIRLFVENGILRDKIIFESEHDHLTGLYNAAKFARSVSESFGKPDTIAVYIASVGDLEYMNDHYGNDAGDTLIKRAADSIKPDLSDSVFGYRIGGDKFAVAALNITKEAADKLIGTWKERLAEFNSSGGPLKCTLSCGMAFGEKDYDTDKLLEQADVGMYREKRRLKEELIRRASAT